MKISRPTADNVTMEGPSVLGYQLLKGSISFFLPYTQIVSSTVENSKIQLDQQNKEFPTLG